MKRRSSRFASGTQVPVGRSQEQIRTLVIARGATGWMVGEEGTAGVVTFRLLDRLLRFRVYIPDDPKEERRSWRALHMAIKAKLVIAEEGIETFDEVFLSNIVGPSGRTVGDDVVPQVQALLQGKVQRLALPEVASR